MKTEFLPKFSESKSKVSIRLGNKHKESVLLEL